LSIVRRLRRSGLVDAESVSQPVALAARSRGLAPFGPPVARSLRQPLDERYESPTLVRLTVLGSPDLNPIEELFSRLKEFLRQAAARTRDGLYEALGEALKLVSAEDILGWFRQAGLCANHV
jgi:hypothetical protein